MNKLTYERANELFRIDYSSIEGYLIRKIKHTRKVHVGQIAGGFAGQNRISVNVDNVRYLAHRVVYLIHHGYMPEGELDHIDQIPWHNHPDNLREVSHICNLRNCGISKNNTSGQPGIFWHKVRKIWHSGINVNSKYRFLGSYNNFDNAVCARLAGEQCLNWQGCDSNTPAYQYVQKMLGRQ